MSRHQGRGVDRGSLALRFRPIASTLFLAVAFAAIGCPRPRKEVVYDLARRVAVAERWSSRDTLLFGTPAAEPHLAEGFYREAGGTEAERFVWARGEAEISLTWPQIMPRTAVVDMAPYRGVNGQKAEVFLNGRLIEQLTLNDSRHRYRLSLPALAQRPGENRLRFVFAATASPADEDARNPDRRQLAASFYGFIIGPADDAGLDDLLSRDAPRSFSITEAGGVPALVQIGPSVVRYAIRLPPAAELRFKPELHPAARAAAGAASFRVTLEARPGEEQEVWSRVLSARQGVAREVGLSLPGRPGEIVRIGLHVGGAPHPRFAWGIWNAPRVLGRGGGDLMQPVPLSPADERRGDALRQAARDANVLLMVLDAARAREFGCYGYSRATTPEIDRIAKEGVLFENAFTPAVYTLGAMSSLWTSQYPDRHHSEVAFSARLPKDRLTLAGLLSAQGIHTAAFVANAVAGAGFGFDRGFSEFHEVFRELGSRGDVYRQVLPPWFQANRSRRFFAYLHFREPHFPYNPQPPFDTRFGPEGPIPKAARGNSGWFTDLNQGRRPPKPGEIDHLVRLYDGSLAFADQEVGRICHALESEGLWEKTVVIIAADHGEGLFEHGWIGHNVQLYEPSIHVPLIVRFPGGAGGGQRVTGLVDLLDLAPTIADVFGLREQGGARREFQGRSLLPVAGGAPGKLAVLSRTVWDRPRYALRDERFKFLYDTRTGAEELYDLQADPGERSDLASGDPLRAAYFRQTLHQWIAVLGQGAGPADEARLSPEQCENLRALGYVDAQCR